MPLRFIDSNVLFRMFAASPEKINLYEKNGSCGNKSLDYAIDLLLKLGQGGYSTSEIALLETVSVASRLGGKSKAEELFRAVILQHGLRVLETRALSYPVSFALVLSYQLEARDSLHLAVAILNGVSALITSDTDFAKRTESMISIVNREGFQLPAPVSAAYQLRGREVGLIEERIGNSISFLSIESPPA